jgi:hypothetical protein
MKTLITISLLTSTLLTKTIGADLMPSKDSMRSLTRTIAAIESSSAKYEGILKNPEATVEENFIAARGFQGLRAYNNAMIAYGKVAGHSKVTLNELIEAISALENLTYTRQCSSIKQLYRKALKHPSANLNSLDSSVKDMLNVACAHGGLKWFNGTADVCRKALERGDITSKEVFGLLIHLRDYLIIIN